jgi:hypothetical protein
VAGAGGGSRFLSGVGQRQADRLGHRGGTQQLRFEGHLPLHATFHGAGLRAAGAPGQKATRGATGLMWRRQALDRPSSYSVAPGDASRSRILSWGALAGVVVLAVGGLVLVFPRSDLLTLLRGANRKGNRDLTLAYLRNIIRTEPKDMACACCWPKSCSPVETWPARARCWTTRSRWRAAAPRHRPAGTAGTSPGGRRACARPRAARSRRHRGRRSRAGGAAAAARGSPPPRPRSCLPRSRPPRRCKVRWAAVGRRAGAGRSARHSPSVAAAPAGAARCRHDRPVAWRELALADGLFQKLGRPVLCGPPQDRPARRPRPPAACRACAPCWPAASRWLAWQAARARGVAPARGRPAALVAGRAGAGGSAAARGCSPAAAGGAA